MRTLLLLILLLTTGASLLSQQIPIWDNGIPNSLPSTEKEQQPERDIIWYTHVQEPSLEIFLPAEQFATGHAVLICPGGGYWGLAYDWEGTDVAKWLNGYGIAAFVLKYRVPYAASVDVDHKAPLMDAQRAMRWIRSKADSFHIATDKVGVLGFSAGGHLASTLGTQWNLHPEINTDEIDKGEARPDFMALIYPVISMQEGVTHGGSKKNLLGENPDQDLVDQYSSELQVGDQTPPCFLVHSQDDGGVPVENSLLMYQALQKHKIPTEMHLLPEGGHGYSLGRHTYPMNTWPEMMVKWIKHLGE